MFAKRVWIPILIVVLFVMGCGLYYGRKVATEEPITTYKPVEVERPTTPKPPPPGETAESGHWHGDEWHSGSHETPSADVSPVSPGPPDRVHANGTSTLAEWRPPVAQSPIAEKGNTPPVVSERPAYIYDPDIKERPAGWDPELVFDTGHEKKIDLNYRPLTEEEQAEYERLKATENPEHYRNFEAGLRILAISKIKEKHRPEVTARIWADQEAGRISKDEALKQIRDFYEFFAD